MTKTELNDPYRIDLLHVLGLIDTPSEAVFDRLTQLASRIIGAPVSLVSIVAADRQYFKSMVGLPEPWASERQTPLSHSFCQHVVTSNEPLIVTDAREHPVLKDNMAIPDLNVIAYLGMPLTTTDGQGLGSFCVIDDEPREWTEDEIEIMRELATAVMTEVELRAEIRKREAAEEALREEYRQVRRVSVFCQSTLRTIKDALQRDAAPRELLHYVEDAEVELQRISDIEVRA